MTRIDENYEYVSLGSDEDGNAIELKVDPVTGALLVDVEMAEEIERTINQADVDENRENAALVTGTDGEIYPLHIDSRNGKLLIELE